MNNPIPARITVSIFSNHLFSTNLNRPALERRISDKKAGHIDCVATCKIDWLSRSLLDFAKLMEAFEQREVSYVSVMQQINSAGSMGRLILNVLLSFAQFEREIIAERTLCW